MFVLRQRKSGSVCVDKEERVVTYFRDAISVLPEGLKILSMETLGQFRSPACEINTNWQWPSSGHMASRQTSETHVAVRRTWNMLIRN